MFIRLIKKLGGRIFDPIFLTQIRLRAALESEITPMAVAGVRCLDVGCGDRPYAHLFQSGSYTGVDVKDSGRPLSMKLPDQFYDGNTLPFSNDSFDLVLSTQVLEHVPNPCDFLKEVARVCKPEGIVVISLPFVYPEHEEPHDFFRFTQYGIEELLSKAGLTVEAIRRDSSSLETVAILINIYIVQNLVPNIRGFGRLYSALLCFPIQVAAMIASSILPDTGRLYLNLVVSARKGVAPNV